MSERFSKPGLFRRKAAEARGRRWLGPVQVATSLSVTTVSIGGLITGFLLAAAATLIEVPERIQASGVLLPRGRLLTVRAPRSGIVERMGIADGDLVGRGEFILAIAGQRLPAAESSASLRRMQSVERELALLEASHAEEIRAAQQYRRRLRERLALARQRLVLADELVAARRLEAEAETRRWQRVSALADRAAMSTQQLDSQQAVLGRAESQWHAAGGQRLALESELAEIDGELEQSSNEPRRIAVRTGMRREALLRELSSLESQVREQVTAPDGGRVAGVIVREGSSVSAGQLLLTVIEPDCDFDAFLYIGADKAGRVRPGDSVELKLEAFPYQMYGTLSAIVASVSAVPLPAGSLEVPISLRGRAMYEIRASIVRSEMGRSEMGRSEMGRAGERWQLAAGTALHADFVRDRRPLYRWLLQSVKSGV